MDSIVPSDMYGPECWYPVLLVPAEGNEPFLGIDTMVPLSLEASNLLRQ